ncbi:S8 family serine peptidase [Hymenobacter sp. 15J16-1T3B]|uniref:S8 family serine peptidase n=1 Tax=Hymenobacter sp. 15J16-1T3B TaxID=2886941 RepID=UPI001D12C89D|nr:S8 family serine peptidase [Hymenobacter sp. 15J16-1T3B]MCC3156185.1 S8 family serine peptidase [Hymenobacter sp. 15J16-1T3B]
MKHLNALLLAALALSSSALQAQPTPAPTKLLLASGTPAVPANFATWAAAGRAESVAAADVWQGKYYRVLQFSQLPTAEQHRALKALGVQLLDYLPQNAYVAALPTTLDRARLQGFGIRGVVPVQASWKYTGLLAQGGGTPAYALRGAGRVAVVVGFHPTIQPAEAAAALTAAGYAVTERQDFSRQLTLTVPSSDLAALAARPWVASVEYVAPDPVHDNNRGRTDHRANALAADYGAGRHYDGTGVNVAHGDDGIIGPHIDFQGRLDQTSAGPDGGTHGDHVAGIIMGAGNLDPRYRGQAVGAFNYYYSYPNNINSAPTHYTSRSIRITSNSYSNGCNAGYTSFARQMDQMSRQMPLMLHVFSSGNEGASNCNYGAGATWGNITGGHKVAKNVMTVGNLSYIDALNSSSSRGPSTDGRIKPEVCAVGTSVWSTQPNNTYAALTGTSMSCPAVSGVVAQLMHAHKAINNGAEAPAALVKAALMNTAEDLGNAGPDFRFGYGRIDALRAVRVLEDHSYKLDSLTQGVTRTHTITVPAGQRQLRVMLYWPDYEAAASSRKNLVNDLDLTLTAPGGTAYQPWVLDPRPTVTNLNAVAVRARDSLNNAEQVTLDLPAAGTYTLTVNGTAVPQGPQRYYLLYTWLDDRVEMTYPLGGEGFVPGETEAVRWNAAPGTDPFTLEYTLNNGTTWTTIASNISAADRYFNWAIPASITPSGQARLRVRRGTQQDESDANITIAGVPANLRATAVCRASTTLAWDAVAGATSYDVMRLGAMYMDSVTTVTGTTISLPVVGTGEQWFAIRARGANGMVGRRTRALLRPGVLSNCNEAPAAAIGVLNGQACVGTPVQLQDLSQLAPTSWQWSVTPSAGVSFAGGTSAASQNPQLLFSQAGTYSVTLTATNQYGPNTRTETNLLTVITAANGPYVEEFRTAVFPPANWRVVDPNGGYTWQLSPGTVTGPDNTSRRVPYVNDYEFTNRTAEEYLLARPAQAGGGNPVAVRFAVAYAPYSTGYNDGLRVDISTDCGQTFQPTGYLKRGATLATVAGYVTTPWAPTAASQWRSETVALQPLLPAGFNGNIVVRFANLNDNGNNLYLTDVRMEYIVTGTKGSAALAQFSAYPVPFGGRLTVNVQAAKASAGTLLLTDALGRELLGQPVQLSGLAQQLELDTEALAAGVYSLRLLLPDGQSQALQVLK